MHVKRWLTGIIALPVLIYLIGFGPRILFHILIFLAACFALHEVFGIMAPRLPRSVKAVTLIVVLFYFYSISRGPFFLAMAVLPLWVMILMSLSLFSSDALRKETIQNVAAAALGALYICLPLSLLIVIDKHPKGYLWVFFLLAVVFANDTGAFYAGKIIGRHRLYPAVSPKKTWEGAVGGLILSLYIGYMFARIFSFQKPAVQILLLTACIAVFGQIGDLAESVLKRIHGIKDSGWILPGHGGILDRIDGLLFGIPILYIYLTYAIV